MIQLKVHKADSTRQRIWGLIGKNKIEPLYLNTRFGIHTFFVKHPIDVIILDKNFYVVTIKKKLTPFKIFFWNPRYCHVVELPSKTINQHKMKPGDHVKLIFNKEF